MELRSTRINLTFRRPFLLPNDGRQVPAGDYVLLIEEERLEGLTFNAYRRIASHLIVSDTPGHPGVTEMIPVSENELADLVACDAAPAVDFAIRASLPPAD